MRFAGKIAVVTGAARGIGAATAKALAAEGAAVIVNDIADSTAVVEEIHRNGGTARAIRADVSNAAEVDSMVQAAFDEFGRLDILVANAAYSDRGCFYELPLASFEKTLGATMWGALHCLRAAAKAMIARGRGGAIVVTGSPHALVPVAGAMPYNMAKAAVDHMARTAATELFKHKIRVNVIHPGWVDTPGERKYYSEEELERAGSSLPWKRLARPDEIARGILFLADDASEYITGTTLTIDGGIQLPWDKVI